MLVFTLVLSGKLKINYMKKKDFKKEDKHALLEKTTEEVLNEGETTFIFDGCEKGDVHSFEFLDECSFMDFVINNYDDEERKFSLYHSDLKGEKDFYQRCKFL